MAVLKATKSGRHIEVEYISEISNLSKSKYLDEGKKSDSTLLELPKICLFFLKFLYIALRIMIRDGKKSIKQLHMFLPYSENLRENTDCTSICDFYVLFHEKILNMQNKRDTVVSYRD